jgi:hypothetical protein
MLMQSDPWLRTWDCFDVSAMACTTQAPLKYITIVAFQELRLFRAFSISSGKLLHFLDVIEALYPRYGIVFHAF